MKRTAGIVMFASLCLLAAAPVVNAETKAALYAAPQGYSLNGSSTGSSSAHFVVPHDASQVRVILDDYVSSQTRLSVSARSCGSPDNGSSYAEGVNEVVVKPTCGLKKGHDVLVWVYAVSADTRDGSVEFGTVGGVYAQFT